MKNSVLKLRISDEEYIKFQEICESKNKTMSEVLRSFISAYTNAQNIVFLDVDKELLKESIELCREKKIKFNDLVKFLIRKAIKNKEKLTFN